MNELRKEFDRVRKIFFPRWDRKAEWRIRQVDYHGAYGICNEETKTIEIPKGTPKDQWRLILIHEIAHAATYTGHGLKWQRRLEKAAQQAEKLGDNTLTKELRAEIAGYFATKCVTATEVYGRIGDVVLDLPKISFRDVICGVGREYGMKPRDFLTSYPRARAVFDKSKRWNEREAKLQSKLFAKKDRS